MRTAHKWIAGLAGVALAAGTAFAQDNTALAAPVHPNGHAAVAPPNDASAPAANVTDLRAEVQKTIDLFNQKQPSMQKFFRDSAGYAVFPNVTEGALLVGAAHGRGLVYEHARAVGEATMTKVTVGAEAGGQQFAEIIFFQTPQNLDQFKQGNYEFSAGVSAVVAGEAAASQADYKGGVVVFTLARTGVMAQASIGGQKFTYQPLPGTNLHPEQASLTR